MANKTDTTTGITFRVHFHDDFSLDVTAATSVAAKAEAERRRPGSLVKKIKILREKTDG